MRTTREKVEPMSTVTSADGTTIDYDAYGNGPTVIFIGGASQHRAIDQRTTEIAKQLAAEGFTAVDYDRRGRDRSGDTPPWSLGREVEDVAALIEATGAPATLYTSSSGAGIALAAVTAGLDVSALALYEPPYFAGSDGTEHITTLERMLDAGQLDEATRYNMTAIIGLPAEAVDEMAQAPWWRWPRSGCAHPRLRPQGLARHRDRSRLAQPLGRCNRSHRRLLRRPDLPRNARGSRRRRSRTA
jgi:pimeloyl-ACP methyl ester carboxylesterase